MPPTKPRPEEQPKRSSMKNALQAIGLIFLVVTFNFGLYLLIVTLAARGLIDSEANFFPALVLFLSFALSVGIILIVALGEKIDASRSENEWIKKIGVTPIMVVVAALLALAASFSGLSGSIFPATHSNLKFMLADVGVSCVTSDELANKSDQATSLLTVIVSSEESYIADVRTFLSDKNNEMIKRSKNPKFKLVQPDDEYYKLLHQYVKSQQQGAGSLDLRDNQKWLGYTVDAQSPDTTTFFPIPTVFGKSHSTRLFVVLTTGVPESIPTASLAPPAGSLRVTKKLVPLFQVEIAPHRPANNSQRTSLSFEMFAEQTCWQIAG